MNKRTLKKLLNNYNSLKKLSPLLLLNMRVYLKTLSHKNMTDNMFNWALHNTNIDIDTLKKVKNHNLTFVRAPDINTRRKITVILDQFSLN